MLGRYIRENLRTSFELWEKSEAVAVLIGAAIAAVLAILTFHGIEIVFNVSLDKYFFPAMLVVWFGMLVLVVTPFRMWRKSQDQIADLYGRLDDLPPADPQFKNSKSLRLFEWVFLFYGKQPSNRATWQQKMTREMDTLFEEAEYAIEQTQLPHVSRTLRGYRIGNDDFCKWLRKRGYKSEFLLGDDETTYDV